MEISDKTKILILVALCAIVIFFFIQHRTKKSENNARKNDDDNDNDNDNDNIIHNEGSLKNELTNNVPEEDELEMELQQKQENNNQINKKFKTINSSKDGKFVNSSYLEGSDKRFLKANDLDKFFEEGHPLDEKIGFQKNDPTSHDVQFANYVPGKRTKQKDVDKFNADSLLPKENNKDWFDDPYEATSVKNTHLINIYRPIGVNTIQTSLKNANRQLRADPIVPKISGVSPFLNSSYEPDTNIRNQALCN
jgi:hypothetical protein